MQIVAAILYKLVLGGREKKTISQLVKKCVRTLRSIGAYAETISLKSPECYQKIVLKYTKGIIIRNEKKNQCSEHNKRERVRTPKKKKNEKTPQKP